MHPEFLARPYQIEDLARLMSDPKTAQFQDPGAGKTYIASMFTEYIDKYAKERVVWTQPGGIMAKNMRDILFSTNFDPKQVRMVQGNPAERRAIMNDPEVRVFLMTGVGYANEWELLPSDVRHAIHDEIHLYFTTDNSKRTKEFYRASKKKGAIVPMTGTIIRGRLDSAYPVLHVMAPWAYGSSRAFLQYHAWFDENGTVMGWKNHERLQEVLKRVGIFRTFKSIYGEEKKVIQVQRCEVGPKVWKVYQKMESAALIELEDSFVDTENPAVAAGKARQLLGAPELFEIDEVTGKDEALRVFLEDHLKSGERLAIFSAITAEQIRIVSMIEKMGGTVGHINGTVLNEKRQEIDREFNANNLQFVVASPATAGIGFNWNFLNTMLFVSVDYTDDSLVQAMRRGIRGLRETPLRVVLLKYEDTIEQRIFEIIDRKSLDHSLVNEGIEATNLSQL